MRGRAEIVDFILAGTITVDEALQLHVPDNQLIKESPKQ
jgi:hypothetical protein